MGIGDFRYIPDPNQWKVHVPCEAGQSTRDSRHKKRIAKCTKCGKAHEIDNPREWEFTNVALKDLVCECGNDVFKIFEVFA
jgi:hypothetical protein